MRELPLMPWPNSVTMQMGGVTIDSHFTVAASGPGKDDPRVQFAVRSLDQRMARQTGLPILPPGELPAQRPTVLITVAALDHAAPQRLGDDEKYTLKVADGQIFLNAEQPLGALRGIETLLQLAHQTAPPAANPGFSVPPVDITDGPRFPWRGLSLDVSRHFIPLDGVKKTIDGMAAVKLNVLHWHLSDDQGFRVESKRYPKLQGMGSDGLFYTQDEVRDLIAYAALRGVRVVPEFDMPGHSTSWLPGYPELASAAGTYEIVRGVGVMTAVLDPTKEFTYHFLDAVVGEMADLFPDAYFHIGGDEVDPKQWNKSASIKAFMTEHKLADTAALQAYFNQRLLKIVTSHGKQMAGWDEILHPDLPKTILIQSWRGQDSLFKAARQGYTGILSAGYYLDLMYPASTHYAVDPMIAPATKSHKAEPSNLSADESKLILGGEAAMWEEIATAENLDAKLWPRLAAIAERFWSPQNTTDVESMYTRLAVTNKWLEWLGLTQRSNLELMRQRLAGNFPASSLDRFSSVLEPVKGYIRHQHKYTSSWPFNRLVDAIPPESEAARQFRNSVDAFLASGQGSNGRLLREQLTGWLDAAQNVKPVMQANSLLMEDLPSADAVQLVSGIGVQALNYLDGGISIPEKWKATQMEILRKYNNKRVGDLLVQITPGVEKLVSAVKQ